MGNRQMDEAAAKRIEKARGREDDFSKRAANSARKNAQNGGESSKSGSGGKKDSGKKDSSSGNWRN
ncbi:hypothetical protein QBC44DRAFT_369707 [Cladorrhinum sp. PSN332]|nr:hypothetical protein QBC44DRAFT_369707 [Cladorrhinum sp. PSN332]